MKGNIEVIPVKVSGEVTQGDDIVSIIIDSMKANDLEIFEGDIVAIAQKVISKSEGRMVPLGMVKPSSQAAKIARKLKKDPRIIELILRESFKIVRISMGLIIVETKHGFVCANAGIDQSNVPGTDAALLLPIDPDKSARKIRSGIKKRTGKSVSVIITDTFGRPFRNGQTNVAIGVAGMNPVKSYIGSPDMNGRKLKVTAIAVADEIASATELVMGKSEGVPVAIIRGYNFEKSERKSVSELIRLEEKDIFRQK